MAYFLPLLFLISIHTASSTKSEKVNVFTKGENGYFCIKIPDLILTLNGTLIAFGEARMNSCSDWTWTDLVYKRSIDNGRTWSALHVLRSNSTLNETNVIGNAAPVQCRVSGRILVPHCRNNREVWFMYSDDDGVTWSTPTGPYPHLLRADWNWVGLGPPAGLQLSSNARIIVPAYHSLPHIDGDFSKGHVIYTDDYGSTWSLSDGVFGLDSNGDHDAFFPSESQAVELENGSVLINSRGASQFRIGTVSNDGGNTFEASFYFSDLLDETTGCEGSMIKHANSGYLYYSGITPDELTELRFNMSVHVSRNEGQSWQTVEILDYWSSAYSALVAMEKQSNHSQDTLGVLYENAEVIRVVFIPDHISFQVLSFQR